MKVLITGYKGFIGSSLYIYLKAKGVDVVGFDKEDLISSLPLLVRDCDFVFHFAGVNRSDSEKEFAFGNALLTKRLLEAVEQAKKGVKFYFASSTRVNREDVFAKTKMEAEFLVEEASRSGIVRAHIDRLCNVFGPGCKINYNSVVATWCYNLSHGIECRVDDPEAAIRLVYVFDLCEYLYKLLLGQETYYDSYEIKLGDLYEKLASFRERPVCADAFSKRLYATYFSYAKEPVSVFKSNVDERGSFSELIKNQEFGQVSLNIIKPGQKKGGHYHFRKFERFFVIKGNVQVKLSCGSKSKLIFLSSGEFVDVPPLTKHSFYNLGQDAAYMIIYCTESFCADDPDTYR